MVYKKYIKRNGKFYGPYIYNSRRVNGKVISEYHGAGKKDYRRFAFFILGILVLAVSVFAILNSNGKISGNVVADNQISSQPENVLTNESGTIIYPSVYFTLILNPAATPEKTPIVPETNNIPKQDNSTPEINTPSTEPVVNPVQTNLSENFNQTTTSTISNPQVQNSTTSVSQEPTPTANSSSITSSAIEPTPSTTSSSSTTTPTTPAETTPPTTSTPTPVTSTEPISSSTTTPEQTSSVTSSTTTPTSEPAVAQTPVSESTPTPPVANFFLGMLKTVSKFFLGFLSPTGMAVSDSNSIQINGEVSADKPFSYSFKDGENVQLLPGSVKTNSKSLSDNTIKIVYENNSVLISTDYSEKMISNATKNNINPKADFNIQPLSEKEKEVLNSGLGNYSIETTKSELYNGRYVVEYVLGDYNIKYSYDSNLNNETLNTQMENDKTKWLRDIANKISNA